MVQQAILKAFITFAAGFVLVMGITSGHAASPVSHAQAVNTCQQEGWKPLKVKVAGLKREVLWKRPRSKWKQGAIIVLHGGGGSHHQFCAGGKLLHHKLNLLSRQWKRVLQYSCWTQPMMWLPMKRAGCVANVLIFRY